VHIPRGHILREHKAGRRKKEGSRRGRKVEEMRYRRMRTWPRTELSRVQQGTQDVHEGGSGICDPAAPSGALSSLLGMVPVTTTVMHVIQMREVVTVDIEETHEWESG
jgi:hypothetical protein